MKLCASVRHIAVAHVATALLVAFDASAAGFPRVGRTGGAGVSVPPPPAPMPRQVAPPVSAQFNRSAISRESTIPPSSKGAPQNLGFVKGDARISALEPGSIVSRRGGSKEGYFATTDRQASVSELGLPPSAATLPRQDFVVLAKPLPVVQGRVAATPNAHGGGSQVVLPDTVARLQNAGALKPTSRAAFADAARGVPRTP